MKKMIFGFVALACACSGFAAEDPIAPPVPAQSPLKFRVNQETGAIEDAPGSDLIKEFLSVLGDIDAGLGSLKEEIEDKKKELDEALAKMPQDSIKRFGTEIYRNQLTEKLERLTKEREKFFGYEPFLQKILKEICQEILKTICKQDASSLVNAGCAFFPRCVVPNYEAFAAQSFQNLKLDSAFPWMATTKEEIGENYLALKINHRLPGNMENEIFHLLSGCHFTSKLERIKRDINARGKIIYCIGACQMDHLKDIELLYFSSAKEIAKIKNKDILEILKEQIDSSIFKAENIIIPKLAPGYRMAKVIMAFQEEVARHCP